MDEKLLKIIDGKADLFTDWVTAINDHNSMFAADKNLSQDQQVDLTLKATEVLANISELCFQYGSFKDTFDNSKMYYNVEGPELIVKSGKTGCVFHLGIDKRGIYLRTYMRHSENLKHMDDAFYKDIFALMDLGHFDIQENEHYGSITAKKYNGLFSTHKSKIFRLLRNYIVGLAENDDDISLGDFHVQWGYKTDFYNVISNCCVAFKILYKLNYSLWKINDLQTKKSKSNPAIKE